MAHYHLDKYQRARMEYLLETKPLVVRQLFQAGRLHKLLEKKELEALFAQQKLEQQGVPREQAYEQVLYTILAPEDEYPDKTPQELPDAEVEMMYEKLQTQYDLARKMDEALWRQHERQQKKAKTTSSPLTTTG